MSRKRRYSFYIALVLLFSLIATLGMLPSAQAAPDEDTVFCEVRPIVTPVAGHFPTSLYKYPYKSNSTTNNGFDQTLTWSPEIEKTFLTNTEYTVTLRLSPNNRWSNVFPGKSNSFSINNVEIKQIAGLPTEGVKSSSYEYDNADMLIHITFEATGSEEVAPDYLFYDDFTGERNANGLTTNWVKGPDQKRQAMSWWKDDMSWIDEENGQLVLAFKRDTSLASDRDSEYVKENFIRSGAVRTRSKDYSEIPFENAYGYYEASIKFPKVNAMWGAFWLMGPTNNANPDGSIYGTEIDIVETSSSVFDNGFNSALHSGGYGSQHKEVFMGNDETSTGINIYDGEFHTFGLEWSPTDYILYVDDIEVASHRNLDSHYFDEENPDNNWDGLTKQNEGINQNPNYIKLSVEASDWSGMGIYYDGPEGPLGLTADYGEMYVDYVYVLNGPKPTFKIDKSVLQSAFDEYEDLKQEDYTDESWNSFKSALDKAKVVLEDPGATQDEVDTAELDLRDAVRHLVKRIVVTGVSPGNGQTDINFGIRSANGKGYSVYISKTGTDGSFKLAEVNFNSKGAHVKGLTNGETYYAYIVYSGNGIVEKSNNIMLKPSK
ncbi:family 16 glycosylhydrolase [Lederbergia citri]|uniref:Family 16 glycosylhydrolase n=1 Tax=Lederbergia citri TaxID=2833580 RepID=A0A942YI78_9BACI|nr:family 16 glycosylhydrolase [Lederbergia citri]MBS4197312.1 family 16 glycosylhydrolase [Lederbergia citri]